MVRYERNKGTKVHLQSDQTHDLKQPGAQPPARRLNPQTQHQKESPSSRAASPPPSRQPPHTRRSQLCKFAPPRPRPRPSPKSFTNPRYEALSHKQWFFFSKVSPVSWYLNDCDNRQCKLRQSSAVRESFNQPTNRLSINDAETLRLLLQRGPKAAPSTKPTYLAIRV
jgi:hypothetical protein